jgi:hypothetical protein
MLMTILCQVVPEVADLVNPTDPWEARVLSYIVWALLALVIAQQYMLWQLVRKLVDRPTNGRREIPDSRVK